MKLLEKTDVEAAYLEAAKPVEDLWGRFTGETDPVRRADLLDAMADVEERLAELHPAVFGPDPIPHEGGRDLAESLALSAELLRLVAWAERGRVFPDRVTAAWTERSAPRFLAVLEQLADPSTDRAAVLADLYAAVEPVVGVTAAEVVDALRHAAEG